MNSRTGRTISTVTEEVIKQRKLDSRNEEGLVLNAMIYLLAQEGFSVNVLKTKKTTNTNKMLIPEQIIDKDGKVFSQDGIRYLSNLLLTDLGYTPITLKATSPKQLKRNKESQVSNGILYILENCGFSFEEKKTKKANVTERLVRINQIAKNELIYNKEDLFEFGRCIEKIMSEVSEVTKSVIFTRELISSYSPVFQKNQKNWFVTGSLQDSERDEVDGFYQANYY
ncbi:hypothetical protein EIN_525950 [Entamoeba invadens IP1]|uniref:Uncharacterized protein n=1 Tax=Entamoeba invadens IP1 TaxID=370355 RepID=A0A0A1U5R9_ENTIV|nr:hypothetical protein EIN_525950 [Entamoeba invadens IP1]ELP89600.1 hypothetical protein EIN_525950 [Entamoeba invadens IP1]|eukprot:XP_004256371.1 hypothetical protein EIN_525950 [Entamoeba invadens IP1]